jgi:hypothetical protein
LQVTQLLLRLRLVLAAQHWLQQTRAAWQDSSRATMQQLLLLVVVLGATQGLQAPTCITIISMGSGPCITALSARQQQAQVLAWKLQGQQHCLH